MILQMVAGSQNILSIPDGRFFRISSQKLLNSPRTSQDTFPKMLDFPARHGEFLRISMQSMAIFHLRHPEVPWSSEGSGPSGLPGGCLDGWMGGSGEGS